MKIFSVVAVSALLAIFIPIAVSADPCTDEWAEVIPKINAKIKSSNSPDSVIYARMRDGRLFNCNKLPLSEAVLSKIGPDFWSVMQHFILSPRAGITPESCTLVRRRNSPVLAIVVLPQSRELVERTECLAGIKADRVMLEGIDRPSNPGRYDGKGN